MINEEIKIYWHNYNYFPYEKELGLREVNKILKPNTIKDLGNFLLLKGDFNEDNLKRLVYFSKIETSNSTITTLQANFEQTILKNTQKKQSTRYSVHGMHEYKGKFNPQIVRALMNLFEVNSKTFILDPFCGSGTTLVEAAHIGAKCYGFDMNPMAILISNAKLKSLNIKSEDLIEIAKNVFYKFEKNILSYKIINLNERIEYLQKWFTPEILLQIECIKEIIDLNATENKEIFYVLISNILRNYSLQDPSDLRIRRRKTPLPDKPFIEALKTAFNASINKLSFFQKNNLLTQNENKAILFDVRDDSLPNLITSNKIKFDLALTSPPYATALPYIDTQRLSIVWLNLCSPQDINKLDANIIGSREFNNSEKIKWLENMNNNLNKLPKDIHKYCLNLENSLDINDGFRRQVVPRLLYRYFSEMQSCFTNMAKVIKKNGYFALIIGKNQTTLGGNCFYIDTPYLLSKIAETKKWEIIESIDLETYQRYDLHKNNSIKVETLLILKRN